MSNISVLPLLDTTPKNHAPILIHLRRVNMDMTGATGTVDFMGTPSAAGATVTLGIVSIQFLAGVWLALLINNWANLLYPFWTNMQFHGPRNIPCSLNIDFFSMQVHARPWNGPDHRGIY